ncbi:uncharacterized membrane protein (DUF485 family) [Ammoniphilus resinae]|uniref:Uncharacterized membrane protein (DUF485 family) n=1 Tax=Ammoniphilus resinae TaxID=861532 RepID=A0ABS4GVN5_9BACL|nr:uncharacterized membrane protein (DUF485 family) [Ammoniphilus resinae]
MNKFKMNNMTAWGMAIFVGVVVLAYILAYIFIF